VNSRLAFDLLQELAIISAALCLITVVPLLVVGYVATRRRPKRVPRHAQETRVLAVIRP
jgi:hypothetical protein